MDQELAEMVSELADYRAAQAAAKLELDRLTQLFEANPAVIAARAMLIAAKNGETDLTSMIKTYGSKQLEANPTWSADHPAIGVRNQTEVTIDNVKAMEWAERNMPIAIRRVLDEKMMSDYAKKADVPWAVVKKIPQVTIATNLTPYLKKVEDEPTGSTT